MTERHNWIIAVSAVCIAGILSFLFFDLPVAIFFQDLKDTGLYGFFRFVTRQGESQWYLAAGLAAFILFRKKNPLAASSGLLLFSSVAFSGLTANLVKVVAGRARPKLYFRDELYGFDFLQFEHAWISFPSGHSATVFSAATTLGILFPQYRPIFFLWAALIAFSRIATTQHYISDVLAGSILGAASTAFLYHRYFKKPCHAIIPSAIP